MYVYCFKCLMCYVEFSDLICVFDDIPLFINKSLGTGRSRAGDVDVE